MSPTRGEKRSAVVHYLLRRLLLTVPTVLGISVVLFSILALAPGDPFAELALNPDIPPEVRLHLRHQFGLDEPLPLRYLRWLTAMLRGEWGYSCASRINAEYDTIDVATV